MLKSNALGLPSLLEADNKTHNAEEVLQSFFKLTNTNSLMIKNYKDLKELKELREFYNNFSLKVVESKKVAFFTKHLPYFTSWGADTDVKRKLPIEAKVANLDNNLLIVNVISKTNRYRKGISKEQFKKEIYTKDYEYVSFVDGGYSTRSFCIPHLVNMGFKLVTGFQVNKLSSTIRNNWDLKENILVLAKE